MPRTMEICNAGNNSTCTATSTHETGITSLIALTGNPYIDLAAYGIDLHGCTIRYLRSSNKAGNTITGRFNISGREETAGATSYEALIIFLVENIRSIADMWQNAISVNDSAILHLGSHAIQNSHFIIVTSLLCSYLHKLASYYSIAQSAINVGCAGILYPNN